MLYTDTDQIESAIGRDLSEDEKANLIVLVPAVQAWIDNYTSSTFDEVEEATTRYYDGGSCSLDIDPCTAITAITSVDDVDQSVSYTYVDVEDYIAEPVNKTVKTEIRRRYGSFPRGIANIAVTALFTEYDGQVPTDIQAAATMICIDLLRSRATDANGANIKSEDIEGHKITYTTPADEVTATATSNPGVLSLLDLHREVLLG